jgi:hypothetical protein
MGCELADGGDVALLGACGEPPQLHVLDHSLAERCHGVSPFSGGEKGPP